VGDTGGKIFRYDIPGAVDNLDPQSTTDPTARMILGNLMEGLVVRTETGVGAGVAVSHEVSEDGLTYTFQLRDEATWQNGDPVTAENFVFAFRRLFSYSTGLASRFSAILGAREILGGERDASLLGVRAEDDQTLIFTLAHPDPFFLERLCDPAAFPCSEAFFQETKGRYGLESSSILTNGPFYLANWDNTLRLELRTSDSYQSARPVVAAGINFHIGRDASEQFLAGNTDLAWFDFDQEAALDGETLPVQKTVWCLVFNQNHPVWGNPLLRQGLSYTVDHELMGEDLPPGFAATTALVPGAVRMMGQSYREHADSVSPIVYDTEEGLRLFELGLAMLGRDELPGNSTVVMPELAFSSLNIGEMQQGWQKYLSAYLNFSVESPAQIETSFRTGEYQMLIMPFTPASDDVASLLAAFTSDSRQNYFGYQNVLYDNLLASAGIQPTAQLATEKYAQAESLILSDAVVIPLFFETSYLALGHDATDLVYSPLGDMIYFKYGRRVD
jgi:oligopeptide transport system substrate-binding protein